MSAGSIFVIVVVVLILGAIILGATQVPKAVKAIESIQKSRVPGEHKKETAFEAEWQSMYEGTIPH